MRLLFNLFPCWWTKQAKSVTNYPKPTFLAMVFVSHSNIPKHNSTAVALYSDPGFHHAMLSAKSPVVSCSKLIRQLLFGGMYPPRCYLHSLDLTYVALFRILGSLCRIIAPHNQIIEPKRLINRSNSNHEPANPSHRRVMSNHIFTKTQ